LLTGKIDLQYLLRSLLGKCKDFKEEETALQFLGTQLGVTVFLTPKFNAELAGEGVDYSWVLKNSNSVPQSTVSPLTVLTLLP
jgi:hypothetical protein